MLNANCIMRRARIPRSAPLAVVTFHLLLVVLASLPAAAQLRVVAPNGGERLRVGSTATIRWQGVAASDTVLLEYSTDGGVAWTTITDKGTGLQHLWNRVPNTPSTRCLLRVSKPAAVGDSVLYLRSTVAGRTLPDAVHFAEFSPDGLNVIGGGAEGSVFIWDSFTGALLRTIDVEQRVNIPSPPAAPGITLISCIRYSPDGRFFATVGPLPDSTGSMVRIFDAASGVKLREWRNAGISAIPSSERCAYSPDGTRLLVGGQAGGTVFDVATGAPIVRLKGYVSTSINGSMLDGDWSRDGSRIVGISTGGSAQNPDIVYSNPVTGDTISTYSYANGGSLGSVRFNAAGTRVITASFNGAARVYDAATGAMLYDIHDYASFPTFGAFSHDGSYFATSGQDAGNPNWKLRVYDAGTGAFIRQVGAIINGMRMLDISPDDARILVACIDGVRIFHAPQVTPGQSDVSDSLWEIYLDSNASVTIAAPTVSARQGAIVDVPITIDDAASALGVGATRIDVTLEYNATLLDPIGPTPRGTISGGRRTIALTFPLAAAADTVLGVLRFRAALGNDSTTALDLSGAVADIATLSVAERDGTFRLLDLCREGGARLLNPDGIAALKLTARGPIGAYADAELETIESGVTRLDLFDITGRMVRSFLNEEIPTGRRTLRLDFTEVPQGRYFLLLNTPTVRAVTPVEVAR